MHFLLLSCFLLVFAPTYCESIKIKIDDPSSRTTVKARNSTGAKIEYRLVNKPHHLLIGRCYPKRHRLLHQENIILINDGKSHVTGVIRMNVDGPVYITCVNVYDEIPNGEGSYPSYSAGGVGNNFVEFKFLTNYGKGFHFFVQMYGYINSLDKKVAS